MNETIVVFDMGATHTRVAASINKSELGEVLVFETDQAYDPGIEKLIDAIRKIAGRKKIKAIAGGIPSVLDKNRSKIVISNNLPNWIGHSFQEQLSKTFQAPVQLFNDMETIATGEAVSGSGRGKSIVGYITISTGIGGIRITNQRVDPSASGFEIGYHYIGQDSEGNPLTFEQLAGGRSIEKKFGNTPKELAKTPAWNQIIRNVAVGVHNAVIFWSPEVIVFGGGMMKDIPLERLQEEVATLLKAYSELPEFRMAELGDRGGLLGALTLARSQADFD